MPYNQFTQIDYTLCNYCGEAQEDAKSNEYFRKEQEQFKKLKEKRIRNEKQRKYYHSEKAVEKRKIKKIELQILKTIQAKERAKIISEMFNNIFNELK